MHLRYLSSILHPSALSLAPVLGALLVLAACSETDNVASSGDSPAATAADHVIRVGGVSTDQLVARATMTRAGEEPSEEEEEEQEVRRTDAENIDWLRGPLFDGLDITYGKEGNPRTHQRVAILKLLQDGTDPNNVKYSKDEETGAYNLDSLDNKIAEYSFKYRDDTNGNATDISAVWYDNGSHFFEGLYVPNDIKYDSSSETVDNISGESGRAPKLSADQHDDNTTTGSLGNYTRLSHYLAMPSNFTLNATVARVKLPFRHRLARVLAYILIDPSMGNNVTIRGYAKDANGKDDPTTSEIRFCKVDVLAGVKDSYNETTQHHTYTPQWKEERKAIPHFVGERGSYNDDNGETLNADHFIAYYNLKKKTFIYPTDAEWAGMASKFTPITESSPAKETSSDETYERTIYGKVPVYDLIVRPTYSQLNYVMYDEEGVDDAATKRALYDNTNTIDFEITLNNGLNYNKVFEFDLDANYQTVVYLHISRERVDYSSSGSTLWHETIGYDYYYGLNNQNGNTLSFAGSGWQRAYTNSSDDYAITDGHKYKGDAEDEYAQYVSDARWIEMFREACVGGNHHGDYFILKRDINIPAAALPEDFVFTGHLDGQDYTITLTNADYTKVTQRAYESYDPYDNHEDTRYIQLADGSYQIFTPGDDTYYTRNNTGTEETPVYEYHEIADFSTFDDAEAYVQVTTDVYTKIDFYKKVHHPEVTETVAGREPTYMFAGLNGNYTTAQEADVSAVWEANVHREKYGAKWYWVPYKTASDGWRGEVFNLNINGGTLFKPEAQYSNEDGTDVTGYVHNCRQGSTYNRSTHKWSGGTKIKENIPSIPEY